MGRRHRGGDWFRRTGRRDGLRWRLRSGRGGRGGAERNKEGGELGVLGEETGPLRKGAKTSVESDAKPERAR